MAIYWLPLSHALPGDLLIFGEETIRVGSVTENGGHTVKLTGRIEKGYGKGTEGTWVHPAPMPVEVHRG